MCKIKNVILIYFVYILLFSNIVLSADFEEPRIPYVVGLKIFYNDEPIDNTLTQVQNINNGDSESLSTNGQGEAVYNLANFKNYYREGDMLEIKACINDSRCQLYSKQFPILNGGGLSLNIRLVDQKTDKKIEKSSKESENDFTDEVNIPHDIEESPQNGEKIIITTIDNKTYVTNIVNLNNTTNFYDNRNITNIEDNSVQIIIKFILENKIQMLSIGGSITLLSIFIWKKRKRKKRISPLSTK